jgi:RecB family exonuclease
VIDRIDQRGDTHLIIDYKTGSVTEANRTKNLEKLTDFQMSIYYELLKGEYRDINLVFMELFSGKITPITELHAKNNLLHKRIEELKELQEFKASRCEDVSRCKYCDYKLLCERGEYL